MTELTPKAAEAVTHWEKGKRYDRNRLHLQNV